LRGGLSLARVLVVGQYRNARRHHPRHERRGECLAQIEKSALSPEKQDVLRHFVLQMPWLAREIG
jgi:hypothetical protein